MKSNITLMPVKEEELPEFERKIQEAFLIAVEENFGRQEDTDPGSSGSGEMPSQFWNCHVSSDAGQL